jgi:hypothetical protein
LKICQPSTTLAYNIHDLLIGHQIVYKLSIVEIPFDITPTNGVTLDELQFFIESTLYQPYCTSTKPTEYKYVDTFYTRRTRDTYSRGVNCQIRTHLVYQLLQLDSLTVVHPTGTFFLDKCFGGLSF